MNHVTTSYSHCPRCGVELTTAATCGCSTATRNVIPSAELIAVEYLQAHARLLEKYRELAAACDPARLVDLADKLDLEVHSFTQRSIPEASLLRDIDRLARECRELEGRNGTKA